MNNHSLTLQAHGDETKPVNIDLRTRFFEQGFAFPLDVFSREAASGYRAELEAMEKRLTGDMRLGFKEQLNYPHVLFRFADKIVRAPEMLDVVEQILGGDIMVWSSTLFIKAAHTPSFVSWHQDLRYWGLSDETGMLSAWLALSDVTLESGCMRFLPGSHKCGLYDHDDTYGEDNSLTRGQEARVDINEDAVVPVCLSPGQVSLHHGKLLHSSMPNRSDHRRIGFITVYVAPAVRQLLADEDYAMLVRGRDPYGHFVHVPSPERDLSDSAKAWHQRLLDNQDRVIYK